MTWVLAVFFGPIFGTCIQERVIFHIPREAQTDKIFPYVTTYNEAAFVGFKKILGATWRSAALWRPSAFEAPPPHQKTKTKKKLRLALY